MRTSFLATGLVLAFSISCAAETTRLTDLTDGQAASIKRGTPWPTLRAITGL